MARVLIIHGIANQYNGENQLLAAWYPALCDGLNRAGFTNHPPPGDCYCPFYGDIFRPAGRLGARRPDYVDVAAASKDEIELLGAIWRAAASTDPDVPSPADFGQTLFVAPRYVERALTSLAKSRFLAGIVPLQLFGDVKQVVAYLNDDAVRGRVRDRILEHITEDTVIVIGHSLGSVVAYEALCASGKQVRLFLTLGSPLGIRNVVFDKLRPSPKPDSIGHWPPADRWTNIAARGDIVAAEKRLAPLFGQRVKDEPIDNSWDAHSSTRYLDSIQSGRAVAEALA